jgi:hypothetical protein
LCCEPMAVWTEVWLCRRRLCVVGGVGFCVVTLTVVTLHAMLCSVSYDTFCLHVPSCLSRLQPLLLSSPHREPNTDAAGPPLPPCCDQDQSRSRTRSRARLCETVVPGAPALGRLTTASCVLAIPGPSMGLLGRLVMERPERNANQPWPDPSSAACAGAVDQCVVTEW